MKQLFLFLTSILSITCIASDEHPVKRIETDTEITYTDGIKTAKHNINANTFTAEIAIKIGKMSFTNPIDPRVAKSYFDDLEKKFLDQQEAREEDLDRESPEAEDEIDYIEQMFNEND